MASRIGSGAHFRTFTDPGCDSGFCMVIGKRFVSFRFCLRTFVFDMAPKRKSKFNKDCEKCLKLKKRRKYVDSHTLDDVEAAER